MWVDHPQKGDEDMLLILGIGCLVGIVILIVAATHGLPLSSGKLGGDKGLRDPGKGPG